MTAKSQTSKSSKALNAKVSSKFKEHNLANINPLDQQFEPTDANPVRQHAQMAGDPAGGAYTDNKDAAARYGISGEKVPNKGSEKKTPSDSVRG